MLQEDCNGPESFRVRKDDFLSLIPIHRFHLTDRMGTGTIPPPMSAMSIG